MDVSEQIKRFEQFVEQNYHAALLEGVTAGNNFLLIDFPVLSRFDPELAELLLDQPEEVLKAFEIAVKNLDVPETMTRFYLRFRNLPRSQESRIRDIRSSHIDKFIFVNGIVRQKSDVRPQVTTAKFECPSCGNVISVIQLEAKFKEPSRCGCGRKGKFRMLSKELVDAQKISLEEIPELLEGGEQPKRIDIFLKNDLVSPLSDKKTNPGTKIRVAGQVKEVPIPAKDGGKLVRFDLMIEANSVDSIEESFGELVITPEEEKKIKELANDPKILNKLVNSMAPSIYGYDKVKEAIIMQLLGGVRKTRNDGVVTRGDMHILLVGDPGSGKSQILKRAQLIAPKSRYVSGKGASGAGLTAAVVKDEFLRGWALEAGALVLANRGFCISGGSQILCADYRLVEIRSVVEAFKRGKKYRIKCFDADTYSVKDTDIINVSERFAGSLLEIELENNERIKLTPNHKLPLWDNGVSWVESEELKVGDYICAPLSFDAKRSRAESIFAFCDKVFVSLDLEKHFKGIRKSWLAKALSMPRCRLDPKNRLTVGDIKKICAFYGCNEQDVFKSIRLNPLPRVIDTDFMEFLGLVYSDGNVSKKKALISFFNSNKELLCRYQKLVRRLFRVEPTSFQRGKGASQIYFSSVDVKKVLTRLGIIAGNKSKNRMDLRPILDMDQDLIKSFLIGVINGDGSISNRKGGGCIDIIGGNLDNLEQLRKMFRKIGVVGRLRKNNAVGGCVVKKGNYTTYALTITGVSNISKLCDKRLVSYKLDSLKWIIKRRDNSLKIPRVDRLIKEINKKLPPAEKRRLYKNSVKLSLLENGGCLARETLKKALKELSHCKGVRGCPEFRTLNRVVEKDVVFLKIKRKARVGGETVYNLQVNMDKDPNYIANFIPVHNCMIDEMDKMSKEDRDAMHESLEQQSYHPETEILFSDGSIKKIGDFVDWRMEKNRGRVIKGKDCEILAVDDVEVLTTDFHDIFPIKVDRVSRHLAPGYFVRIEYSNGRRITVTPEHPVFVFKGGGMREVPAEQVRAGYLAPSPRRLPTSPKRSKLMPQGLNHHNNRAIGFPSFIDGSFSRLLGYMVTEGYTYYNPKTRYAEIGVSNTDKRISAECSGLFEAVFDTIPGTNTRFAESSPCIARKELDTVRCSSIPLYRFFKENFEEMVEKAPRKRLSNVIRTSGRWNIKELLRTAFKGDGFVDSERFGFSTASFGLAKDYQDLLLQNGIFSYIAKENRKGVAYYKVVISGRENMDLFIKNMVEEDDSRYDAISYFCARSKGKLNHRDPVPPEIVGEVDALLKGFGMSTGYFYRIIKRGQNSNRVVVKKYLRKVERRLDECKGAMESSDTRLIRKRLRIPVKSVAEKLGTSCSLIYYLESKECANHSRLLAAVKQLGERKIAEACEKLDSLMKLVESDLRLVKVRKVEKVKNKGVKWVYDITVEPTRTFISEGLVLHNTVTISKANIQATLRCETTVLAAANPKWGRFDPFDLLGKQIDLPPALISRFDLIFPIKDLPNKEQDERLAGFVLNLHQTSDAGKCDIDTDTLRKYISYARRTCVPKLTDAALEEIKEYYVKMRSAGGEEGGVKAIPITARQLEALVRLAEASAKSRLSDKVTRKDSRKAIELLHYCMSQVGIDPDTGKIDIDVLATGVSSSARNNIIVVKEIINDLENKIGKTLPVDDVVREAQERGITIDKVEEILEKLKRSGDIFEPKRGFIQKI